MTEHPDTAISVTALRKSYVSHRGTFRRTRVSTVGLAGIDLTIRSGELFGLLGPNGAGKDYDCQE